MDTKKPALRKCKPHRKSRSGCRNCKLRRVKCDEARPTCRNCIGQCVICNYDVTPSSSQSLTSTVIRDDDLSVSIPGTNLANDFLVTDLSRMLSSQYPQNWPQLCALGKHDIDRLNRWQTRTVFTLGPYQMSLCYKLAVSKHITEYPYLLHAVLAMVALQDASSQLIAGAICSESSRQQYYYHSRCAAALFNGRLSKPAFKAIDRNAIWTTACLLGNMTSLLIESHDPEISWPLSSSSDSSFDWLNMHRGMAIIYRICVPDEPGGLFHSLLQDPTYTFLKNKWTVDSRDGVEGIPPQFIDLCGLKPSSNSQNSPYHASVRLLAQIWDMESTHYTAFRFLTFISLMTPDMKTLLVQRDAPAMVILAYWYSKMFHVHYWLHRRAVVGCAAICIYLMRYHSSDYLITNMLQYPLSKLEEFYTGIPELEKIDRYC